jgi:hypothetical protein
MPSARSPPLLTRNSPIDREDVAQLANAVPLDASLLRARYRRELRPIIIGDPERHDLTPGMWIQDTGVSPLVKPYTPDRRQQSRQRFPETSPPTRAGLDGDGAPAGMNRQVVRSSSRSRSSQAPPGVAAELAAKGRVDPRRWRLSGCVTLLYSDSKTGRVWGEPLGGASETSDDGGPHPRAHKSFSRSS